MQGKVLNMNGLTIINHRYKLKVKCNKNPHYAYTHR